MSRGAIAPDPIVRTALELLPVPDHAAGFWAEVDALLKAEPPRRQVHEPALAVGPAIPASDAPLGSTATASVQCLEVRADPALNLLPPALRRRSNVVLLAVAVAAAALVAVSGFALVRNRVENGLGTSGAVDVSRSAAASTVESPYGSGSAARSVLFEVA